MTMQSRTVLTLAIAIGLSGLATAVQSADGTTSPATQRAALKSEAKGLALGIETAESISATQLDIAARVLTGRAECEYSQVVDVDAVSGQPGLFKVSFKSVSYVMVPEETTTGAVRLTDKKAGVVWLQIPAKSMLLDGRAGHRLVDRCTQSEQRAAVAAVNGAATRVSTTLDGRK
jgi:hypothetical protein